MMNIFLIIGTDFNDIFIVRHENGNGWFQIKTLINVENHIQRQ